MIDPLSAPAFGPEVKAEKAIVSTNLELLGPRITQQFAYARRESLSKRG